MRSATACVGGGEPANPNVGPEGGNVERGTRVIRAGSGEFVTSNAIIVPQRKVVSMREGGCRLFRLVVWGDCVLCSLTQLESAFEFLPPSQATLPWLSRRADI